MSPVGRLALELSLGLALAGCAPEIGDACTSSVDCSQQGDRLCDTTQPEGYCTVFNCEPDTCPEDEAICVAFDYQLDPACREKDDAAWARFQRTFCMQACEASDDCRSGYECVRPESRGALVVDREPVEPKACLAVSTQPPQPADSTPPDICTLGSADAGLPPPYAPDGG